MTRRTLALSSSAFAFVLTMGIVNLFGDVTYEGGASINGLFGVVLTGLVRWGVGYATQDSLLKSLVAGMLPEGKRSRAFGFFYTGYGVGWLIGSIATGLLYRHSVAGVIAFSMAVQLSSIPLFIVARRAGG